MQLIRIITSSKENLFSLLLALIPISFIAGNLLINLNIVLLILTCFILYPKDVFKLEYFLLDKLLFSFFILIIISGIYNDIYFFKKHEFLKFFETTIRSLLFLKYLLLYLSLRILFKNNVINLKLFFLSSTFSSLFVSLDIFYQFFNGKDIFGFETVGNGRRLGGPFGDELIAGGYIQRFALFSFFLFPFFYKKISDQYSKFIIPSLFFIFFIGIILSGNRMPFILFLFSVLLILLFQKQTRKYLFYFVFLFSITFVATFNISYEVKRGIGNFYNDISKMSVMIIKKDFDNKSAPQHLKEFSSFYDTWLLNKYLGGGIKNFRYYCHIKPINKNKNSHCNMHPHNYYLEVLTETGILGFFVVMTIFINLFHITFYKRYFSNSILIQNNFIIPFIFLFIAEVFPLKSTGSFFTTGNTTYLFLIIGILIGLLRDFKFIENKN